MVHSIIKWIQTLVHLIVSPSFLYWISAQLQASYDSQALSTAYSILESPNCGALHHKMDSNTPPNCSPSFLYLIAAQLLASYDSQALSTAYIILESLNCGAWHHIKWVQTLVHLIVLPLFSI